MQIKETVMQTRTVEVVLDHALYLPMAGRLRRGIKTTCTACYKPITDDFFIGGFIKGRKNILLHIACTDPADVELARAQYEQRTDK